MMSLGADPRSDPPMIAALAAALPALYAASP
jgi:hypothetical protein